MEFEYKIFLQIKIYCFKIKKIIVNSNATKFMIINKFNLHP